MNTVVKEWSSGLTKDLGGQEMFKSLKITRIHQTHVILVSLQAKRYTYVLILIK